ncbi:receptor-like protein 3 [Salvia divinorum]|uniref:Receptor-like protein 3 n=1 Tax=Salvia divinorum TaxID=28513 RepID=A0ABD1HKI6_SALDI
MPMGWRLFFLFLFEAVAPSLECNQLDRDSLLRSLPSPPGWNLSSPSCCLWDGVACNPDNRITRLSLPGRGLSGSLTPFLANLTFLSHLNLSSNRLSGPLPSLINNLHLHTLDLSSNRFNGSLAGLASTATTSMNVSNNSFTGPLPSSICTTSPLLTILDFSFNQFSGVVPQQYQRCSHLQVFRAGFNSLSGHLPHHLYTLTTLKEISLPNNAFSGPINATISLLTNLTVLELHDNQLTGPIPPLISSLSSLQQLQLHTNNLTGPLPPSLTHCSNLTTLLLRNNHLHGDISLVDFSKLQNLQALDLGNNTFSGQIPSTFCLCRSLTALRLAYNRLVGELPPCMASLKNLAHLSLSDNSLSGVVGALKILRHCDKLQVLFLSRCFNDEPMPDDDDLVHLQGFQNLQILTLGGCSLKGQIPWWISKLRKLKVLNLSYNQISGPIPTWLGDMPSLFVLNLTKNTLSGGLPRELGRLPALITDNSSSDLSSLALPFLFDSQQYNRLFNLPRGLKVGYNSLSGEIPAEIGQLKLLHLLDLNNNHFNGSIPAQLSGLVNLERLDMSENRLTGEIPQSLTKLHFLSYFSVAGNDLEGEIPRGGQFETFPSASFQRNRGLCGYILGRNCSSLVTMSRQEEYDSGNQWYGVPFGMGYFVGFFAVSISLLFQCKRPL